ncbi:MAG TPA: cytochrome c, partial [Acidobacteriota bacterium]
KINGQSATTFPFAVTEDVLVRGKQRYQIFCTPCHDGLGSGEGMVVRRGFRRPPSFHIDRLRKSPHGYFYDVITNGFATMPSYAEQIAVTDRWAIIAYVRALQISQNATLADVPETERKNLEASRGQ